MVRGPMIGTGDPGLMEQPCQAPQQRDLHPTRRTGPPTSPVSAAPSRFDRGSWASGAAMSNRCSNATEQPAGQRAPRDDADSVVAASRQHFELDRADEQVVVTLFADQPERAASHGPLVGLGDVPAGEVAAADVDDLALLYEQSPSPARSRPTARPCRRDASDRGRCGRSANVEGSRRMPHGCAVRTVAHRSANPTSTRTPWWPARPFRADRHRVANQRPMISSVVPAPLLPPYRLAVSKKLMPSSIARSMILCDSSSEVSGPKFIVPRHSSLTRKAVRPNRR